MVIVDALCIFLDFVFALLNLICCLLCLCGCTCLLFRLKFGFVACSALMLFWFGLDSRD